MNAVTFLRLRPGSGVNEITAATRRREGTTAIELEPGTDSAIAACVEGGIMPVALGAADGEPAAWVVDPPEALDLAKADVAGWRITVQHTSDRSATLDALARSQAAYLRTGRSRVQDARGLTNLPGINSSVSVFVDSVEEAISAVNRGVGDLLLRDWSAEQIGDLRDSLDGALIERVAIPGGVDIDLVRVAFGRALLKVYLDLVDGSGFARPRYSWAPGIDDVPPLNERRLSAQWPDAAWVGGSPPGGITGAGPTVRPILERALEGSPPNVDQVTSLLGARGDDVDALASVADSIRADRVGDTVTYVVNRNINYTNVCYFRCGFCAFSKGPRSLNLRGDPHLMSIDEVVERTIEAEERGATEVCLQGGIHPEFTGQFYVDVLEGIKEAVPRMHVHGFTPLEVWQGAETLGMTVRAFLEMLRGAGLGSLPGTAAEILDDRVRRHLCPDKITTSQWSEVMLTAHDLGLRSTSTIMFGHIDDPRSWANHLDVISQIQSQTGGFTEFVPLPFVHMASPHLSPGPDPSWADLGRGRADPRRSAYRA